MVVGRGLLYLGLGGASVYGLSKASSPGGLDPANLGIVRFGRAAVAVSKIGFDYKRSLSSSSHLEPADYEEVKQGCHQRAADTLLDLCCANGGCFIKVGQHIGALDYLLPEEYVKTMRVLHHRAPEMPLSDVYDVIREELEAEPSDLFTKFDEKPLGTASLAQVHRATLRSTGEEVAVKVQHRHVKNHSMVDIYTMDILGRQQAAIVRLVKLAFPQFEFMWLADEMRTNLPLELSFTQEGRNAERISMQLDHLFKWLKIPKIHWTHTTDRVLTMEYCEGGHINDREYLLQNNIDPHSVSTKISQMYADMIFRVGYVHCDPHPGNVLVQKDKISGDPIIVLLDHGLYKQLTFEFRQNYAKLWMSILSADRNGIRKCADKLGVGSLSELFACMVSGRSWNSIVKGIEKQKKNSAESKEIKANAQRYIREIVDVLSYVNREMILIFKTNDLLRAIEHSLGTQHSMSSFIQMSRACYRCLNSFRYRSCKSSWCRFKVGLASRWYQIKISMYQVFLWIYWTRLGQFTRSLLFS